MDFAGLENFCWHLVEYEEEVRRLYAALLGNFRRIVEIVARGPGRYLSNLENFTADTLGPRRYQEFLLPVYEEFFPMLHAAGKIIGCHYDGRLANCRRHIAGAPIDLIESLTPPPEGDLTLAQARAAWPDKLFWSNINVGCYELPPPELEALVLQRVAEGAPDGRRFAFEVSEQYPANWQAIDARRARSAEGNPGLIPAGRLPGPSQHQHGVAVAEKPVFARDGLGVDLPDPGDAVGRAGGEKRGDEAEQGGAGLVKVGDERVDPAELARRVNEQLGLGDVRAIQRRRVAAEIVFHRAHHGGADRDPAAAGRGEEQALGSPPGARRPRDGRRAAPPFRWRSDGRCRGRHGA